MTTVESADDCLGNSHANFIVIVSFLANKFMKISAVVCARNSGFVNKSSKTCRSMMLIVDHLLTIEYIDLINSGLSANSLHPFLHLFITSFGN